MHKGTSYEGEGSCYAFVLFGSLRPSQQLWSCGDGQFT